MILKIIQDIAKQAGEIIMPYFKSDDLATQYKIDERDPVTAADYASDIYIKEQLSLQFPDDYILTEETANQTIDWSGSVWIVDPLDGTLNFTNHKEEFCVMIGRCIDGIPTLGVVYFPVTKMLYFAESGLGAWSLDIHSNKSKSLNTRPANLDTAIIHGSKTKMIPEYAEQFNLKDEILTNMTSNKTIGLLASASCLGYSDCQIASGNLDAIITFHNRTGKRDTCAPQVILQEAGGIISNLDGSPLDYKQESPMWKFGHVVSSEAMHEQLISFLQ